MRNQNYWVHWFEVDNGETTHIPPPMPWPKSKGLHDYDLYLQRGEEDEVVKAWRYTPSETGTGKWVRIKVGAEVDVPGLKDPRIFVINKLGRPSYVLKGTVAKLYNELEI